MSGPRRWKPVVIRLHRWIALSAGIMLMLNAFTGLVLLAGRPLDERLHSQLFKVEPRISKVPLEVIARQLRADFPGQALTLHPPHEADRSLDVSVRGDAGWEGRVFIDPYTGERLGRRDRFGVSLDGLFELHSSLLADNAGRAVLGIVALCMPVMFLSGLYLWWPLRWSHAFKITLNVARVRSLFDLHRVAGATLGLWVLACVGTGGYLAYRPAGQWVNRLAGATPLLPPKIPSQAGLAGARAPGLDQLVATGEAALPGGQLGSIVLPPKASAPIRLRTKLADDPHPIGLSSVWLDPRGGQVLRVDRWSALAPGERVATWLYPLHSGQLAGAIGVVITSVGGLSLLGFGISGTWLWWVRRSTKRPKPRGVATRRAVL